MRSARLDGMFEQGTQEFYRNRWCNEMGRGEQSKREALPRHSSHSMEPNFSSECWSNRFLFDNTKMCTLELIRVDFCFKLYRRHAVAL